MMDWSIFHGLNGLMAQDGYEDTIEIFAALSAMLFAVAALGLWLGDRPGGPLRWRLATTSAFAAAGVGLLISQVISHLWARPRPYVADPGGAILVGAANPDPSFPSDHATAAFAIAFAILFFSRRAGIVFLVAATAIAMSRVFAGVHYPSDVVGGAVVGLAAAAIVVLLLQRPIAWLTALLARLTDPLVRPLWALVTRVGEGRAGSL